MDDNISPAAKWDLLASLAELTVGRESTGALSLDVLEVHEEIVDDEGSASL